MLEYNLQLTVVDNDDASGDSNEDGESDICHIIR